jgi:phospholipase C
MRILFRTLRSFATVVTMLALIAPPLAASTNTLEQTKMVFIIVMENHNWEDIKASAKAPFINSLLGQGASADNYRNPPNLHPSEPNYVWLVAGSNHDIKDDAEPAINGLHGVDNLGAQLNLKGISWKSYQEAIDGKSCPLTNNTPYAPKHNPFVFFDDLTDGFSPGSAACIAHNRPFTELKTDLAAKTVPRYVFITPNICNDMHGDPYCDKAIKQYDPIKQGDAWLGRVVPMIRNSSAFKDHGALFITWDESEGQLDEPIGLILLSPGAKPGYVNATSHFTHSALLRTVEDIFGLPTLGGAAKSSNLVDLFK